MQVRVIDCDKREKGESCVSVGDAGSDNAMEHVKSAMIE
jgi:hypothetical protein